MVIKEDLELDGSTTMQGGNYQYNEKFKEWLDSVSANDLELSKLIKEKKFLFENSILSNNGINTTYMNYYILTSLDSSIYKYSKSLADTLRCSSWFIDVSKLTPNRLANITEMQVVNLISFKGLYALLSNLIDKSNENNTLVLAMTCEHPDIEDFIDIKSKPSSIPKIDIFIKIDKKFMDAVLTDSEYTLEFIQPETRSSVKRIIKAKQLFRKIIETNWKCRELGCFYWDKVQKWCLINSNQGFKDCNEKSLITKNYFLGSLNLSEFVLDPFTSKASFDTHGFNNAVRKAIVTLNEVLDKSIKLYSIKEQKDSIVMWRQIGLGVSGLADMLIKMGIMYGSKQSLNICDEIGFMLINKAIETSALLAKDYGCFPMCCKTEIATTDFIKKNTSKETLELVKKYGLRNSQLLTIESTKVISSMLDVSNGVEPISDYSKIKEYIRQNNTKSMDYFITADKVSCEDIINMQAVLQKHIDGVINSTIHVPDSFTATDIEALYIYAYKKGLKRLTVVRDE